MEPMLHSFGGSALDRHIFDFETTADGGTEGVPAGEVPSQTAPAADPLAGAEGGETEASSAVATEIAPAWTPEQLTALRESPEMQDWLAGEASTIADARFQTLLEQARSGVQQTQPPADGGGSGGQVDLNELLNPYGDNFGANLVSVFNTMLQGVTQSIDERFQPFTEQAQQVQAAENDEVLKTAITETATGLGGLKGGDAAVQRVMADVRGRYMPEAMQVYGNTERAARVAIDKAIRAERDYQTAITGTAAVENVEHLTTLTGARTDLPGAGSGSGVVTLPNEPLSTRERVAKYAPQLQTAARSTQ